MGNESCAEKYGSLFSPELKQIFREYNLSVPYILEFLEDEPMCDDRSCRHHVFNEVMQFGSNNALGIVQCTDVDWVTQCHQCMCLMPLVDRELTLQDIADAMGVSREAVRKHEASGLGKLRNSYVMGGDGEIMRK